MIIYIPREIIEENAVCVKEDKYFYKYCDEGCYPIVESKQIEYETDVFGVKFDNIDLENIVNEYTDEIINILLNKHKDELMKAIQMGDSKGHKHLCDVLKERKSGEDSPP